MSSARSPIRLGIVDSDSGLLRVLANRIAKAGWQHCVFKSPVPTELLARVEAVVRRRRRQEAPEAGEPVMAGDLEIRADKFPVLAGSVAVDLTWGYAMVHGDRSVDVFVRKLRHKLERVSPDWRYIHTHFGIGYRFADEPVDAVSLPAPADASAEPTTLGEPVRA